MGAIIGFLKSFWLIIELVMLIVRGVLWLISAFKDLYKKLVNAKK